MSKIAGRAAVTAGVEREIKLDFDVDQLIPDLVDVAGADVVVSVLAERSLDAVYFDTADLRLTRWGCILRHRSEEGWMVKLPDPGGDEGSGVLMRAEVRFGGAAISPPPDAIALVAPFARGGALRSVAHLHTTRKPVRVDDLDGKPIAELVEDGVTVRLPGQAEWWFQMVEIEFADERSASDVSSIVDRFVNAGAHPTSQSKVARALGAAAAAAPDVVVPPVSGSPTAREVIHAAIARSVESHLLHLPIARVGEGTEGVHQARVALRRLRSDLRTFSPLLDPIWAAALSAEVRWLGDRLGEVRDADVRIEVLNRVIDEEPSIDERDAVALVEYLRIERNQAHARLLEALDSARCAELLDGLVGAAADPRTAPQADDPSEENIPGLVDRPWRKLRKAVGRLGPRPTHAEIHRIRIKAKRCRYAAEAVEPAMGKPARRLAKAMKRIQNSLGDLNDAIVIRAHLAATASEHKEFSYMAGELSGLLVARAGHCEADFRQQWNKTDRIKLPNTSSR
jgi:CHAD domain-containing protein